MNLFIHQTPGSLLKCQYVIMTLLQVTPSKKQRSKWPPKLMQKRAENRAADALGFAVCAYLLGFSQPPFLVRLVSPSWFLLYLCDVLFPQRPEQSGAAEEVEMPQLQVVLGKCLSRTSVWMCHPHLSLTGQRDAPSLLPHRTFLCPSSPHTSLLPQRHSYPLPWASRKGTREFCAGFKHSLLTVRCGSFVILLSQSSIVDSVALSCRAGEGQSTSYFS